MIFEGRRGGDFFLTGADGFFPLAFNFLRFRRYSSRRTFCKRSIFLRWSSLLADRAREYESERADGDESFQEFDGSSVMRLIRYLSIKDEVA